MMTPPQESRESRLAPVWARLIMAVGILALIWWTYAPVTTHGFVNWDDQTIYPEFLPRPGLNRPSWDWAWSFTGIEWVPLARLAYLAQAELGGLSAQGIHQTSLAVHAINTLLLWWLTARLLARQTPSMGVWVASALATLILMLHPLRAEPVAWAAGQLYLWCTTLVLLSVVFLLRSWSELPPGTRSPGHLWALLALLSLTGALLFKPTAMVIFFWFPLMALHCGQLKTARPLMTRTLAAVMIISGLLATVSIVISWYLRVEFQTRPGTSLVSLRDMIPNALYALGLYVKNLLWPTALSPFYGPSAQWRPMAALAGTFLVATIALARKWPSVWYGVAGFVLGLLPILGFARTGRFVAADRYTYLPTMALTPLLAGGLLTLWRWCAPRPRVRILFTISGTMLMATLSLITRDQVRIWQSSEILWRHALAHNGAKTADVWSNLGGALEESGQFSEALTAYDQALTLDPHLPEARLGRAVTLYRLGRLLEAVAAAESTVQLAPNFPLAWQNLASLLINQKDYDRAEAALSRALELTPTLPMLHYSKAQIEAHRGRYDRALLALEAALERRPQWTEARVMKGSLLAVAGRPHDAVRVLEDIIRDHPDHLVAMVTLAQVWWSLRNLEASMALLQKAARAHPGSPIVQQVALEIVNAAK